MAGHPRRGHRPSNRDPVPDHAGHLPGPDERQRPSSAPPAAAGRGSGSPRRARRRPPPRSRPRPPAGRATSGASSPPTGSSRAGSRGPARRCPAPSRGSARTGRGGRARVSRVPIDAEGSSPSEPAITAASSERMSPNRFSVTRTSNAGRPLRERHRGAVDEPVLQLDVGEVGVDLVGHLAPQAARREDVRLVDLGDLAPAGPGELEREGHDPADLRLRVPQRVDRGPALVGLALLRWLAEVQAAGELAEDQAVDALEQLRLERRGVDELRLDRDRAQIGVQPQAAAQREQRLLGPDRRRRGCPTSARRPRRAARRRASRHASTSSGRQAMPYASIAAPPTMSSCHAKPKPNRAPTASRT